MKILEFICTFNYVIVLLVYFVKLSHGGNGNMPSVNNGFAKFSIRSSRENVNKPVISPANEITTNSINGIREITKKNKSSFQASVGMSNNLSFNQIPTQFSSSRTISSKYAEQNTSMRVKGILPINNTTKVTAAKLSKTRKTLQNTRTAIPTNGLETIGAKNIISNENPITPAQRMRTTEGHTASNEKAISSKQQMTTATQHNPLTKKEIAVSKIIKPSGKISALQTHTIFRSQPDSSMTSSTYLSTSYNSATAGYIENNKNNTATKHANFFNTFAHFSDDRPISIRTRDVQIVSVPKPKGPTTERKRQCIQQGEESGIGVGTVLIIIICIIALCIWTYLIQVNMRKPNVRKENRELTTCILITLPCILPLLLIIILAWVLLEPSPPTCQDNDSGKNNDRNNVILPSQSTSVLMFLVIANILGFVIICSAKYMSSLNIGLRFAGRTRKFV